MPEVEIDIQPCEHVGTEKVEIQIQKDAQVNPQDSENSNHELPAPQSSKVLMPESTPPVPTAVQPSVPVGQPIKKQEESPMDDFINELIGGLDDAAEGKIETKTTKIEKSKSEKIDEIIAWIEACVAGIYVS